MSYSNIIVLQGGLSRETLENIRCYVDSFLRSGGVVEQRRGQWVVKLSESSDAELFLHDHRSLVAAAAGPCSEELS